MPYPPLERAPGHVDTGLPVEAELAAIVRLVATPEWAGLVLTAEPGAGKSSLVPIAVADGLRARSTGEKPGRVLVLEPRRLAARATAARLAQILGDRIGGGIGLTIRGQRSVGDDCVIEVVTEAVLTNRLQRDPSLPGVGAVVFDEFHERHLHTDLALALSLEARAALRPDLAIIVMSATLDPAPIANLLGGAETMAVPGRTFPVTTHHLPRPDRRRWVEAVASAAATAFDSVERDVLVFVPGRGEVERVSRSIREALTRDRASSGADVFGLHGGSSEEEQRQVIDPSSRRRIIVATAVAETSITLPSVEAVVDGGLLRRSKFDSVSGLGRLETLFTTRFAADQRRGRAGRVGPGQCWRLWSVEDERLLDESTPPEVVDGDPLPLAFELARWGDAQAVSLEFLDHPGPERLRSGLDRLRDLGLVDDDDRLTSRGGRVGSMPVHPRLGTLVDVAPPAARRQAIAAVAVVEADVRSSTADLERLVDENRGHPAVRSTIKRLERNASGRASSRSSNPTGGSATQASGGASLAEALAAAWPDRVAIARPDRPGVFLMAAGREVGVGPNDPLAGSPFLVVAAATGDTPTARVRMALGLDRATVLDVCADRIGWHEEVGWDDRTGKLKAERVQRLGAIALHREPNPKPSAEAVTAGLRTAVRRRGLDLFHWSDRAIELRTRLDWLHREDPGTWPAVDDETLLADVDSWLPLETVRSPKDLRKISITSALMTRLDSIDWQLRQRLDELAPTSLPLPGGHHARVDYSSGRPTWSVRLQRVFGIDQHPTVGPNATPITIELLSPANRPAQTTNDLPGFWTGSYAAVRADLRGRYPKHDWPEDPTSI